MKTVSFPSARIVTLKSAIYRVAIENVLAIPAWRMRKINNSTPERTIESSATSLPNNTAIQMSSKTVKKYLYTAQKKLKEDTLENF